MGTKTVDTLTREHAEDIPLMLSKFCFTLVDVVLIFQVTDLVELLGRTAPDPSAERLGHQSDSNGLILGSY